MKMRMFVAKTILFICECSLFFGTSFTSPPDSLRQVNVLYRHGDRSPISVYPLDINNGSDVWPDGFGWLTNIGKMQQYELGQFLKQRYDGFLNTSHYTHKEILIKSSAVERCLMSAYCNLAGLFPPEGDQKWNPNIPWQPIPVQTTPVQLDNVLAEGVPCPRYDQLYAEVLNSSAIKKEEQDNKAFYTMVEEKTGIKQESIADIWQVIDTLICERAHNLTLNDWVTPDVWNKLDALMSLNFEIQFELPEMARLKGGPLLKEIINNLDTASYSFLPKFYMYSAHDTTVASLLRALKVFYSRQPMYRALVIIELHEINNVSEVKIFYRNDTSRDSYELIVPGCESPCTLQKFKNAVKDTIPDNWTAECQAKDVFSDSKDLTPASWIALAIGIGLGITLAVAIIIMIVNSRKKRSADYSKI